MKRSQFTGILTSMLEQMSLCHPARSDVERVAINTAKSTDVLGLPLDELAATHPLVVALVQLYIDLFCTNYRTDNFSYHLPISALRAAQHLDEAWEWYEKKMESGFVDRS